MLESAIGLVSGIISGMGMGGGTILILLLSLFLGLEQHVAQATNLIFFVPTSIAAIITNFKQKCIDVKLGLIIGGIGMIGAIIGAKLAQVTDSKSLRKYFGIFLAIIAIKEIYSFIKSYKNSKKSHTIFKQN